MLQRRQRRCARSAIEARDRDVVGTRLGNTGGNRADADFRDKLDRHVGRRVDVLQVVDQLCQIFDRIDVMRPPEAIRRAPRLSAASAQPQRSCARADYNVKACKGQDFRHLSGHEGQNRTTTLS